MPDAHWRTSTGVGLAMPSFEARGVALAPSPAKKAAPTVPRLHLSALQAVSGTAGWASETQRSFRGSEPPSVLKNPVQTRAPASSRVEYKRTCGTSSRVPLPVGSNGTENSTHFLPLEGLRVDKNASVRRSRGRVNAAHDRMAQTARAPIRTLDPSQWKDRIRSSYGDTFRRPSSRQAASATVRNNTWFAEPNANTRSVRTLRRASAAGLPHDSGSQSARATMVRTSSAPSRQHSGLPSIGWQTTNRTLYGTRRPTLRRPAPPQVSPALAASMHPPTARRR